MGKKRIYAFIVPICTIIVLSAACWWGYSRLSLQEKQADTDLFALVPTECEAILETKDVNALCRTLQASNYTVQYGLPEVSDLLNLFLTNVESLTRQQAHGLSTEMNSQLIVSFHQPDNSRNQVIYGRLGNGDIHSITKLIQTNANNSFPPKKTDYRGERIMILPIGQDFLTCYIQPDFFAISFQKKLIERVIDTYIDAPTKKGIPISSDRQSKHNEQLSLYLPPTSKDGDWRHFEIRMNANAIFLTGNYWLTEGYRFSKKDSTLVERTDGALFPEHIQMMMQTPLHTSETETPPTHPSLSEALKEAGIKEEVTYMQFASGLNDTVHQLLLFPTLPDTQTQFRRALRHQTKAIRRPSIWTRSGVSPVWQCDMDSTLALHFARPTSGQCWVALYQNNLLLTDCRETLHVYITEMSQQTDTTATDRGGAFVRNLDDLAEQADYTLIADLEKILGTTTYEAAKAHTQIPPVFFKHKDFFKHFILSIQYIRHGEDIHTQMILDFQN